MSLSDSMKKVLAQEANLKLRPEILLLERIPDALHGLAPRVIMGQIWWDRTRRKVYEDAHWHCQACGVHKRQAKGPNQWLDAHEVYETDYLLGKMVFKEIVALCPWCHAFIHTGRQENLLKQGKITKKEFDAIQAHGNESLRKAGLKKKPPVDVEQLSVEWSDWRLVIGDKEYEPIHKDRAAWEKFYADKDSEEK